VIWERPLLEDSTQDAGRFFGFHLCCSSSLRNRRRPGATQSGCRRRWFAIGRVATARQYGPRTVRSSLNYCFRTDDEADCVSLAASACMTISRRSALVLQGRRTANLFAKMAENCQGPCSATCALTRRRTPKDPPPRPRTAGAKGTSATPTADMKAETASPRPCSYGPPFDKIEAEVGAAWLMFPSIGAFESDFNDELDDRSLRNKVAPKHTVYLRTGGAQQPPLGSAPWINRERSLLEPLAPLLLLKVNSMW